MSASPGSLESHSIVACCRRHRQSQCQLKPQVCSECWPAGLRRPAHRTCPFLLPGLLANGKRSALKRNTVLLPVCTASLRLEIHFGRGKKNAEHFVPAEKEERSWAGETSEPLNRLGGATHLLRLVSEEQNRVWELLGQSSEPILTDTDLWPCSASFAQISAGLIVRAQFLNCPFVRAASCAENQML